ncbi:unnamed protein product [Hydatigera taeniaeformis]|uniref:FHA domain-containing protein n=1 Tax=Hydatigena taeniaeformis TaxID=6205 RepID=A0A0R3X0X8_HYDTA|nr:unnamed protein product [Hydatigera taeniaeformis]
MPQVGHFVSPVTLSSQPLYFGSPVVLPPSQLTGSLPLSGNFSSQAPVSVPFPPQDFTKPSILHSGSPKLIDNTASVHVSREHVGVHNEVRSASPGPTDTIISIKNWVAVNLEEDGECRIAGHSTKSGQLICSERIIFVNDRGNVVSDGKNLFKLCGPISWALYELQHPQAGEINPTPQLRKAFSNGFPRKNRGSWMRALYRFLFHLTRRKPSSGPTDLKSISSIDGVRDMDESNLGTDVDARSTSTMDLPFLVLNSRNHNSRGRRHSPRKRRSESPFPSKSCYSDSPSGTGSMGDDDDPIPSASILCEIGNRSFPTKDRRTSGWRDQIHSSSPLTVETGVQTSNDFSSPQLTLGASLAGRVGRRDVGTETSRTREQTPLSNWMEKDMRLNVALRNAEIECTPSPSPPPKALSPKLHSHGSHRRHSEEVGVGPSYYSAKKSVVVGMDGPEFLSEQENDMVAGGSRRHSHPQWRLKESGQSRRAPHVSALLAFVQNSRYSLRHRFVKKGHMKSGSKAAPASSALNRKIHSRSRESRHSGHYKHHQLERQQAKGQTLDRRHQLITQLGEIIYIFSVPGVVDVRDLKRTRSGRLSVPTRDTWHRQKLVFDGADISVDHGEYGKSMLVFAVKSIFYVSCQVMRYSAGCIIRLLAFAVKLEVRQVFSVLSFEGMYCLTGISLD